MTSCCRPHAVAKGVLTGPGQRHVSYIHSPMRWPGTCNTSIWSVGTRPWLKSILRPATDAQTACLGPVGVRRAPTYWWPTAPYIAERIRKCWRRESSVIHPRWIPNVHDGDDQGDHFVASRMVPLQTDRTDRRAFSGLPQHRLIICGDGSGLGLVQQAAAGSPNIELRGPVPSPS